MVRISWSMVWSQRTTKSQWLETTWMLCGSVERWEELEGFAVYNDHWGTQADRGSTIISHCHLHMRSWDSLWQGRQSMHQLLNASTGSTHVISSHISLVKASRMAVAYVKVWGAECNLPGYLKGEVGWYTVTNLFMSMCQYYLCALELGPLCWRIALDWIKSPSCFAKSAHRSPKQGPSEATEASPSTPLASEVRHSAVWWRRKTWGIGSAAFPEVWLWASRFLFFSFNISDYFQ